MSYTLGCPIGNYMYTTGEQTQISITDDSDIPIREISWEGTMSLVDISAPVGALNEDGIGSGSHFCDKKSPEQQMSSDNVIEAVRI